jgi:hypothetical protein
MANRNELNAIESPGVYDGVIIIDSPEILV